MSLKIFILIINIFPEKFRIFPGDVIHDLKLTLTETIYLIFSNPSN